MEKLLGGKLIDHLKKSKREIFFNRKIVLEEKAGIERKSWPIIIKLNRISDNVMIQEVYYEKNYFHYSISDGFV